MGKFFDENVHKLGANRVFELGIGDSSNDLEGDFASWKAKLWPALIEKYKAEEGAQENGHDASIAARTVSKGSTKSIPAQSKQSLSIRQYQKGKDARIESIRECKQTHNYGSCLEIIFNLEGTDIEYVTASNLAVFATNRDTDVDKILAGADGNVQLIDSSFPLP